MKLGIYLFLGALGVLGAYPSVSSSTPDLNWEKKVLKGNPQATKELLQVLAGTQTGKEIFREAVDNGFPVDSIAIHVGEHSITENTLIRSFDLSSGKEWFEERREITLSTELTLADAVLDLAHELTHYVRRHSMNPYSTDFSETAFIRHGIEGKGGELDAFEMECRLARELSERDEHFPGHRLCKHFTNDTGFQREDARKAFYHVGDAYPNLALLQDEIPELSAQSVIFRSAQKGRSYPDSLMEDYVGTKQNVCANNARRLRLIQDSASAMQRRPAALNREAKRIKVYQDRHCRE